MANNNGETELNEFKQLVSDLVAYKNKPGIDVKTKRVIQDLSVTLRYQLEFDLMKKLISESTSLKDTEVLLKNMIDKIKLYEQFLIEEHNKTGSVEMNMRTKIKLDAMKRSLDRLERLNEIIKTRNFNSYVTAMNNQVTSTNQLIGIIKRVLSDGYDSYFSTRLIKGNEIDENVITIICSILKDKHLFSELKEYIDEEKRIKQMEEKNNKEKEYFEVLKQSGNYTIFFNRYITLSSQMDDIDVTEKSIKESLAEDYAKRESMASQTYSRALYKAPLRKLDMEIYAKKENLRNIAFQRKEFETAEQKLREAGFGEVLDAFQTKIILADDIYEKFAIYVKSKANSEYGNSKANTENLDIDKFLESFEKRLSVNSLKIDMAKSNLEASLESKYALARKLILNYHDDTKKIVEMFGSDDDMSRIIAFYVLNLLCSAKNFDVRELSDIYEDSEELKNIITFMEKSLAGDIEQINQEALKVSDNADRAMNKS